jgi:acyl-CoA synthetase (NDP forming)
VKRAEFLDNGPSTMDDLVHRLLSVLNPSTEELLAHYSIPTAPIRLATELHEAESIADKLGYPVVMKIASPDILHKSDVGGVILDIKNHESLLIAYTQILQAVKAAKSEARIEGVHIQPQIPSGQEVIVGAVRDPQFGPLMMFGSGGVEVEGLKDVSFALAPLNQAEALKMIRKTWAGRKLAGFRNIPPADEASVVDVLIKLSHLVMENELIEEIEINPLQVLSKGAVAVDVRIKVRIKHHDHH